MTGADLHMLAGAYALGALDEDERQAFEGHLASCAACSQEVAEFRATAAHLGLAAAENPPPAMKQQVLARVAQVRQEPPGAQSHAAPTRSPARRRARFALAASMAAAVGLGGVAAWQYDEARSAQHRAEQAESQQARIAAVLTAPDAHAVTGTVTSAGQDARATVVTSQQRDKAVFLTTGLPALPTGRTYQLWFDDAGVMRPAGLVPPGATNQVVLLAGPIGAAQGMGITVEPAGGSLHPTSAPLAVMPFGQA